MSAYALDNGINDKTIKKRWYVPAKLIRSSKADTKYGHSLPSYPLHITIELLKLYFRQIYEFLYAVVTA
uniref:Transposase n=1 Tax=Steinernema glaseri TaxID=37863 RepID=A0A1I7ZCN4_9BILA